MSDFFIEKRVYYHDTDAGGVVYYARYLNYLEEARTELLRSRGIDTVANLARGVGFAVVHLEVDYKAPARYGDLIRIHARVEKIGSASIRFAQEVRRGRDVILISTAVLACIDADIKPRRLPEEMRKALNAS